MIITSSSLAALRVGFRAEFQRGLGLVTPMRDRVATTVPSTGAENKYGWLKKLSGLREWIGPRQIDNIAESDYSIRNKPFEKTIAVDRDDIDDDNLGQYSLLFAELGETAAAQPEQMVWQALKDGFTAECFDGQPFFDADHPITDADGSVTTYSNHGGGASTPWFLLCTKRVLKPIIFQDRKKVKFVNMDDEKDANVFNNKQFVYGADMRCAVGYGFPQMAFGSKQVLDATSYAAARAAILNMTGDGGRPLGLVPDLLVVPPSLESAANKILKNEFAADGETNEWRGTAEPLVVPWLA
jgi:phage major head subunit gpT-like protein